VPFKGTFFLREVGTCVQTPNIYKVLLLEESVKGIFMEEVIDKRIKESSIVCTCAYSLNEG
jgi:hypothetical protein